MAETAYIELGNSCPAQHLHTKGIASTAKITNLQYMWLIVDWSGCGSVQSTTMAMNIIIVRPLCNFVVK